MMKTAVIFVVVAILIFAGVYYYYLSIGGIPLEELFNQAVGLPGEEEGGNGVIPIVVSLVPYAAIITVLVAVGVFLHFSRRKQDTNLPRQD
ncbi:MAG TPA: hypothetical protein VMS94_04760 [Acidobacteriota bacterium]|jgi:hypothetical protein|nr:hypothetical protein [Acidobacteriota bacterium]